MFQKGQKLLVACFGIGKLIWRLEKWCAKFVIVIIIRSVRPSTLSVPFFPGEQYNNNSYMLLQGCMGKVG